MDERHLRSFIAVADHLHFRRAAEHLHVAQPALSQTIQALEAEVGTDLISRSTRRVELTPAGRVFLEHAQRTIQTIQRGKLHALKAARGQNTIVLGATSAAMHGRLPEMIRTFSSKNPTVEWTFREIPINTLVDQLKTGNIDLGATHGFCSDPYLEGATIERETCMLAIPSQSRLARSKELALDSLAGEKLLVPTQRSSFGLYENLLAACSEVAQPPDILPQQAGAHVLLGLVAANIGVLCVPRSLAIPQKGVVYRRIRGKGIEIPLRLYWRKADLTPVSELFIDGLLADRR